MEPEGSLPHSHHPANCPYSAPDKSSPYPPSHFLKIHLTIILPPFKWSLSLSFPHQNPVQTSPLPLRAKCPANLVPLDLITRIIFDEEYRSLSSSLCSRRRFIRGLENSMSFMLKWSKRLAVWSRHTAHGVLNLDTTWHWAAAGFK